MPTYREVEALIESALKRLVDEGLNAPNAERVQQLDRLERRGDRGAITRFLDRIEGSPVADAIRTPFRRSHSGEVLEVHVVRSPDDRLYDLEASEAEAVEPQATLVLLVNFRTQTVDVRPTGSDSVGERDIHAAAVVLEAAGVPKNTLFLVLHQAIRTVFAKRDWLSDPDPTWRELPVGHNARGEPTATNEAIERWLKLRLRVFAVVRNPRRLR